MSNQLAFKTAVIKKETREAKEEERGENESRLHSRKCLPNEVIKSRRQLDVRMMSVCVPLNAP